MYLGDVGAQPSVSLTMATDGSDDDDILSGKALGAGNLLPTSFFIFVSI